MQTSTNSPEIFLARISKGFFPSISLEYIWCPLGTICARPLEIFEIQRSSHLYILLAHDEVFQTNYFNNFLSIGLLHSLHRSSSKVFKNFISYELQTIKLQRYFLIFSFKGYDAGESSEKPHGMTAQCLACILSKILNFERWHISRNF
jgi:hypothetical protein